MITLEMAPRLALLLGFLGCVAAFNPMTDQLTYDIAQQMLTNVLNSSRFSAYIPQDVKDEMTSLAAPQSKDELQNLVDLANKYKAGQIDPPKSRTAALAFIQANAPATYDRVMRLFNNFLAKYNTLSSKAQAFYNQLESKSYQSADSDMAKQAMNNIKLAILENDKWQNLDDSVKDEFRSRWPEITNLIESTQYQTMLGYLKRVTPQQLNAVINSMTTMIQKQMQAGGASASSSNGVAQTFQTQVEAN